MAEDVDFDPVCRVNHIHVTDTNVFEISDQLHKSAMRSCRPPILQGSREEYLFLGLAEGGECGELQNVIKKVARDGMSDELLQKIRMEAADTYAYLFHIATVFGFDLHTAWVEKTDELVNQRRPEWAQLAIDNVLAAQRSEAHARLTGFPKSS